jgi:hypothetical protein
MHVKFRTYEGVSNRFPVRNPLRLVTFKEEKSVVVDLLLASV